MKMLAKQIALLVFLSLLSFYTLREASFSPAVFADTNCQPIYGGGQTCLQNNTILINKMVQNPETKGFVDNLSTNDARFSPGQSVLFQLIVTNTGSATLEKTTVTDTFPQFISFVSGDGIFDSKTNTFSFTVNTLLANESRTFTVSGRVASFSNLPQGITCVINLASATTNNNQVSRDNSQLCIQTTATVTQTPSQVTTKGGLFVQSSPTINTAPATGPEMLPLLALIPSGIGGLLLRRKTSR